MTTKNEPKAAATGTTQGTTTPENLQDAYQIHTIAQLTYYRIAGANPWASPAFPLENFEPPAAWPPPMGSGSEPTWALPWPW